MNTGLPVYSVRGTVIYSLKIVELLQSCSVLCVMLVMSKELLLISNILTEIAQLKNLNQAQYCTCICWLLSRKVGDV